MEKVDPASQAEGDPRMDYIHAALAGRDRQDIAVLEPILDSPQLLPGRKTSGRADRRPSISLNRRKVSSSSRAG